MVGDERVIMPISDPVDDSHMWKHRCHVSVRGSRAYIGTEGELVVIDVADAESFSFESDWSIGALSVANEYLYVTSGDGLLAYRLD